MTNNKNEHSIESNSSKWVNMLVKKKAVFLTRISHKVSLRDRSNACPIRLRGLKGATGILDNMSKSLEGARPYRVDGSIGANE